MATPLFFSPDIAPALANPAAIYRFSKVRFTLLTNRLVRVETSPTGTFEDHPSQVFWYRNQPIPKADVHYNNLSLSIETDAFHLTYQDSTKGFNPDSLQILIKDTGTVAHLDSPNSGRLPGTARTLDETNGSIPLLPGLLSRSGWVQLDDSQSLLFKPDGWLEPRPHEDGYRDLYFLVCGQEYKAALQDYQKVTGHPGLLPRAFLGNWWSRFWEYSQQDIQQLVERFQQEEIPLSAFIIDMDWHITKTGNASSGWTGFSWNRELFPDPPALLQWLHNYGLITALNLHPAEGIHSHEDQYIPAARAMGLDPETKEPIPFDIADPAFTKTYFDKILHPLEAQGVDFWWLDWQQGELTKLPGLDPLWWLNHLHFYDLMRNSQKRPVIFSRWGGPGNHRYPIGFSGDTCVSWDTLAFQPYFTASAANAAYGWWSHDIGGHMRGMEDGELYTRWVQFGVLSPIFRLHCTKDNFIDRSPWAFDSEVLRLTRKAMQFRHALVPYLYTMARRNKRESIPLITPLYYDWPEEESAYIANGQYLLGSELMAAPITTPVDPNLNQSRQGIWFPPGEWFDFFTGEPSKGPQWEINYYGLEDIPLFARAGAILPMRAGIIQNGCANPKTMDVLVFPGKDGSFKLYEDDGITQDYQQNGGCNTEFNSCFTTHSLSLHISPAVGDLTSIPQRRIYRILFRGVTQPDDLKVALDGIPFVTPMAYNEDNRTAIVGPIDLRNDQDLNIEILNVERTILAPAPTVNSKVMRLLKRAKMETVTKWKISTQIELLVHDIKGLAAPELNLKTSHLTALIETITDAGTLRIKLADGNSKVILINPHQRDGFKFLNDKHLCIDPHGTIVNKNYKSIKVDYFGLIKVRP